MHPIARAENTEINRGFAHYPRPLVKPFSNLFLEGYWMAEKEHQRRNTMPDQKHTVWRYTLDKTSGAQVVFMPIGATLIHAHMQHGLPTVWASVDPDAKQVPRKLAIIGTGHLPVFNLNKSLHIGTCHDRGLVWHIYEII